MLLSSGALSSNARGRFGEDRTAAVARLALGDKQDRAWLVFLLGYPLFRSGSQWSTTHLGVSLAIQMWRHVPRRRDCTGVGFDLRSGHGMALPRVHH